MGCVLEDIVIFGLLAGDDVLSFLANLNHGITEPASEVERTSDTRVREFRRTYRSLPVSQIRWAR